MNRSVLKFLAGGLGLVAIAVGVLYWVDYIRYRQSPEYRAEQYFKDLEKRYREDPYGGSTPEETLQLFIDALKKGDVELASKYFVVNKQENQYTYFVRIREQGLLDELIRDAAKLGNKYPLIKGDDSRFIFEAFNDEGELILQTDLARGPNGKWKIVDL